MKRYDSRDKLKYLSMTDTEGGEGLGRWSGRAQAWDLDFQVPMMLAAILEVTCLTPSFFHRPKLPAEVETGQAEATPLA